LHFLDHIFGVLSVYIVIKELSYGVQVANIIKLQIFLKSESAEKMESCTSVCCPIYEDAAVYLEFDD
jgi:hypothetical protein